MQYRYLALGGFLAFGCATAYAANFPMFFQDEAVPFVTSYSYSVSLNLYKISASQPLLCANTPDPNVTYSSGGSSIIATYNIANPNDFIFGALSNTPTVQQTSNGLTLAQYNTSQTPASYTFGADASLGFQPLVCYVTDVHGVRKLTRDLFDDSFDHDYSIGAAADVYDSSVAITVEPTPPSGFYQYYVDINIPTPPQSATFVLRDGYNMRVFNASAGGWCQAATSTATSCTGPTTGGDINFTQTLSSTSLPTQIRFIVYRQYNSGITSGNNGELLALAALFSPPNLGEVPLGNNVAAAVMPIPQ